MASPIGFKPMTARLEGESSVQLSYGEMVGAVGIEPTTSAL